MRIEDLNLFLKTVSFRKDNEGFFVGQGQNNRSGAVFKIALFGGQIACFKNNNILFQLPLDIGLGTLLVVAQEFGIIHERFIYERVDFLEEEFFESQEEEGIFDDDIDEEVEDEEDEEIDDLYDKNKYSKEQIIKNSKFMALLNKGKSKQ